MNYNIITSILYCNIYEEVVVSGITCRPNGNECDGIYGTPCNLSSPRILVLVLESCALPRRSAYPYAVPLLFVWCTACWYALGVNARCVRHFIFLHSPVILFFFII